MNCKLQNSLMALSTTGLLLMVGLIAATPLAGPADLGAGLDATPASAHGLMTDARAEAAARRIDARAAAIDARAQAFEDEFRKAGDAQHAIALTTAFVAETATEAALAAALAELNGEAPEAESEPSAREAPRKRRNSRSALALPYFSFARGLRGGNGS